MDERYFSFSVRVYFEDTDAGGVVYYANYQKYFERARTEMLFHIGYTQTQLRDKNQIGFMVSKYECNLNRPGIFEELLEIRTYVNSVKGASILLTQNVYRDGEDKPLVESLVRMACVNTKTLTPERIPKELAEKLRMVSGV